MFYTRLNWRQGPDIATQQQKINQHGGVERAVNVLDQARAINTSHALSLDVELRLRAQRRQPR